MATAIISLPKAKAKLAQEAQRKSEIKTSWAGRVPYPKHGEICQRYAPSRGRILVMQAYS